MNNDGTQEEILHLRNSLNVLLYNDDHKGTLTKSEWKEIKLLLVDDRFFEMIIDIRKTFGFGLSGLQRNNGVTIPPFESKIMFGDTKVELAYCPDQEGTNVKKIIQSLYLSPFETLKDGDIFKQELEKIIIAFNLPEKWFVTISNLAMFGEPFVFNREISVDFNLSSFDYMGLPISISFGGSVTQKQLTDWIDKNWSNTIEPLLKQYFKVRGKLSGPTNDKDFEVNFLILNLRDKKKLSYKEITDKLGELYPEDESLMTEDNIQKRYKLAKKYLNHKRIF